MTHSLKPPGFNPRAYEEVKTRFHKDLLHKFQLVPRYDTGKMEEVIQEFETLPKEICAGKLQCQYYEGVSWVGQCKLNPVDPWLESAQFQP
jgi:hypothetical protein